MPSRALRFAFALLFAMVFFVTQAHFAAAATSHSASAAPTAPTGPSQATDEHVPETDITAQSSGSFDVGRTRNALSDSVQAPFELAQAGGDAGRSRPLEPRYQPREPEPKSGYNSSYAFALTRSVADSTIAPAGQVPLYILTIPLDIALLPFALIGGLFG